MAAASLNLRDLLPDRLLVLDIVNNKTLIAVFANTLSVRVKSYLQDYFKCEMFKFKL